MLMKNRAGFTLAETLITLAVMGIVGAAMTQLMVSQSQYFNEQAATANARSVARSATGLLMSEMRMLDVDSGLVRATRDSVTLRVPYRMGIVCSSTALLTNVMLLPVDSTVNATASYSGYAWRDSTTEKWSYVEGGTTVTNIASAACTLAAPAGPGIANVDGIGQAVTIAPALPAGAVAGRPVFLYQKVSYGFGPSTSISGTRGLFRRVWGTGVSEELVAPFDTAAKFRFYSLNSRTAADAVPSPIKNTRGIELVLTAKNEKPKSGNSRITQSTVQYTTSVFFKNRNN